MLHGMLQSNVDIDVFQETKVTGGGYTRESGGYRVATMKAPRLHHGGVTVFYCKAGHFTLEEICLHRSNVSSL